MVAQVTRHMLFLSVRVGVSARQGTVDRVIEALCTAALHAAISTMIAALVAKLAAQTSPPSMCERQSQQAALPTVVVAMRATLPHTAHAAQTTTIACQHVMHASAVNQ